MKEEGEMVKEEGVRKGSRRVGLKKMGAKGKKTRVRERDVQ